jgi:hypothetical protein
MSDRLEMAADLPMHPDYNRARKKLRDIRRILKTPLSVADVVAFNRMWSEAADKEPDGRQCVLFVEDLIEQNTPLKW